MLIYSEISVVDLHFVDSGVWNKQNAGFDATVVLLVASRFHNRKYMSKKLSIYQLLEKQDKTILRSHPLYVLILFIPISQKLNK